MTTIRTVPAAVLAAVALAAGLSACSSGDDGDDEPGTPSAAADTPSSDAGTPTADDAPPPDEAEAAALEGAVRGYIVSTTAGNADAAWPMVSERCRDRWGREEFDALVREAGDTYGPQEVEEVTVDRLEGGLARVTYTVTAAEMSREEQPWAKEEGQWKFDAC
ncbi:hypothetical protein [Streptomyces sp. RFCAC02]|uniref:hypothetical protein n=1 Tax=Streptomyces sp. RFCAC02 TaxID=2499143 RepID=UPI0010227667|nr:hypothetical protein [Streptomyces sp. RFCAC02]